ncbi:secreted RxLR effector protein 161-like [Hevea brasiliensis]|uniref:secreted RxLR effector protein 161-like n=1 Tax=Hevea brasiliensis TaxID=3981 RepID=UPI0025F53C98|nr:secreted RxLR effector protein 161-like [Hevea brasiliensis]
MKKFGMENCNSIDTPIAQNEKLSKEDGFEKIDSGIYRSVIGYLLYLTASRPDIMYAKSLLSRFMHEPSQNHFKAAKRVLRYVKGTIDLGIWFKSGMEAKLVGYADSDWGGSIDDMKSTSGFVFSIGSGVISWSLKKQDVMAQSTAEAEYISAAAAVNQAIWFRKIMKDLKHDQEEATIIFYDNQSAVAMAKNPVFHGKTKHIKIKTKLSNG